MSATIHFRGRPSDDLSAWLPLCGAAGPITALTTRPHDTTCEVCRQVLGIKVQELPPPKLPPAPPGTDRKTAASGGDR